MLNCLNFKEFKDCLDFRNYSERKKMNREVAQYMEDNLGLDDIDIKSSGRLPGVSHTDPLTGRETSFDLIVTMLSYSHC